MKVRDLSPCRSPLRSLALALGLALASASLGCATAASGDPLELCVARYNEGLRWKRLSAAAALVAPERRAEFLRRYLARDEDLHIESMEVRAVSQIEGEELPTFDVTVVAEAYLMPSTVLQKTVITERWQQRNGQWLLVTAAPELVPAVPGSVHAPAVAPSSSVPARALTDPPPTEEIGTAKPSRASKGSDEDL